MLHDYLFLLLHLLAAECCVQQMRRVSSGECDEDMG